MIAETCEENMHASVTLEINQIVVTTLFCTMLTMMGHPMKHDFHFVVKRSFQSKEWLYDL